MTAYYGTPVAIELERQRSLGELAACFKKLVERSFFAPSGLSSSCVLYTPQYDIASILSGGRPCRCNFQSFVSTMWTRRYMGN